MWRRLLLITGVVAACTTTTPDVARRDDTGSTGLPPMLAFPAAPAPATTRSNASIAADFMALTFALEDGTPLQTFTRLDGPITVRVTGRRAPSLGPDLSRLLARLRREAGIDISRVASDANARITIEARSREEIRRASRNAACFVAPNVSSWAEYRRSNARWTTLTRRERMAIFVPADAAPQLIRDCLHEEIAQALGPVNDLYHLQDSVLNDDNLKSVLTGFDMLILRTTYDPALQTGMNRSEVASRLSGILDRLNPRGRTTRGGGGTETPRAWIDTLEAALDDGRSVTARRRAAERAVSEARRYGWRDTRLGFALLHYGRLSIATSPSVALSSFDEAGRIYARTGGAEQAARVAEQTAAFLLRAGRLDDAIQLVDRHVPAARRGENAALLATLMLIKAEALDALGETAASRKVRGEALGWARYGFGNATDVRTQADAIAALNPAPSEGLIP